MTVLDVPIVVPYSILFNLARDVGADWDIDYLLEIGLSIDLPVLGDFTIPVTSKGEIKLPTFKDYFWVNFTLLKTKQKQISFVLVIKCNN